MVSRGRYEYDNSDDNNSDDREGVNGGTDSNERFKRSSVGKDRGGKGAIIGSNPNKRNNNNNNNISMNSDNRDNSKRIRG